jgi:hypothetical protein
MFGWFKELETKLKLKKKNKQTGIIQSCSKIFEVNFLLRKVKDMGEGFSKQAGQLSQNSSMINFIIKIQANFFYVKKKKKKKKKKAYYFYRF